MTLLARLSRLFQADVNAVLDQIEEPELLLKQAIRDMEEALASEHRQLRLFEYDQQQLVAKQQAVQQDMAGLDEKLALCFQSGKDDLARAIVKRKLEWQRAQQALTGRITALKQGVELLTKQIHEHQVQLDEMKQKAEILMEDNRMDLNNCADPGCGIRDEDIEIAYISEKQKWAAS